MDWTAIVAHWEIWLVTITLIVAAWIDGRQLKVPNWITFPMFFSGLIYHAFAGGLGYWDGGGFCGSLWSAGVGLLCLLPLYAVGGMGAGDVKLMAGMGAWLANAEQTWEAFVVSVFVGAAMAIVMVWRSGKFQHHYGNFLTIANEWMTIRNPRELAQIAAERKPTMHLLPYGIPICIGSIAYFFAEGLMV